MLHFTKDPMQNSGKLATEAINQKRKEVD